MNKRKLILRKKFRKKELDSKKGITLIALVITIIVMLILAGVSLNATIGENGILSQAKNATYMQSCSALSDFLNEKYIDAELDNIVSTNDDGTVKSAVEKLCDNYSDWFYMDGSNNYIIKKYNAKDSDGNSRIGFIKLRLIRKNNLPEEIRKQLKDGEANNESFSAYEQLKDVYGVTGDLQVYYCSDGIDSSIGADYTSSSSTDSYDGTKTIYTAGSELAKSIANTLGNDPKDFNMQDLRTINELEISDSVGINDLTALRDLPNLKTLTLTNYTGSLKGIQRAYKLTSIYFCNSKKEQNIDYTGFETLTGLEEIKFYNPNDTEVEKLCNSMKDTNYSKLKRIYMYGAWNEYWKFFYDEIGNETYNVFCELSNLMYFNKLTQTTCESVEYLIFANCSLKSTSGIENFINATKVRLSSNLLQDLNGIENLKKLNYINLTNNSNLSSINELKDISTLKTIRIASATQLLDLSPILINSEPNYIYAIGTSNLNFSGDTWQSNSNSMIKKLSNIANLFLDNKYSLIFSDRAAIKVTSDADANSIMTLSGKTTLKSLSLSGNKNLSDTQIQSLLESLPNLENVNLDSTNLETLNFAKDKTNLKRISFCNTKVTDITTLEKNTKLGLIRFDNSSATVKLYKENDTNFNSKIVKLIENAYSYYCSEDDTGIIGHGGGFVPIAQEYYDDIGKLTNLTKMHTRYYGMPNYKMDFSNTGLKSLYVEFSNHMTIKVPSCIENIATTYRTYFSADSITNLKKLSGNGVALVKCDNINTKFLDNQNGVAVSFGGDVLDSFSYMKEYVGSWVGAFSWSGSSGEKKYGAFDSLCLTTMTNCTSIYVSCASTNRLDGEDFANYERDFSLELSGCKVDNFTNINKAIHLTSLKLQNNRISDISFFLDEIENSNITELNLKNNNLINLCTYKDKNGNSISIKTAEILAKLPKLQYIDVSGNADFTDFTALRNNGFVETAENSKIFEKK